jgi:alpha-methylacyl-CoA racemase
MVDGSALLTTSMHGFIAEGMWTTERETNLLDGGAPFYSVYETADGGHVAVGALEPQFYSALLAALAIPEETLPDRADRTAWPRIKAVLAARFLEETREEWAARLSDLDVCVAPVLSALEAPGHAHNRRRGVFVEVDGVTQPAPAPRFSATPADDPPGPSFPGRDTDQVLGSLGLSREEVSKLRQVGAVA